MNNENKSCNFEEIVKTNVTLAFKMECTNIPQSTELAEKYGVTDSELYRAINGERCVPQRRKNFINGFRTVTAVTCAFILCCGALLIGNNLHKNRGDSAADTVRPTLDTNYTYPDDFRLLKVNYVPEGYELKEHLTGNETRLLQYNNKQGEVFSVFFDASEGRNVKGDAAPEAETVPNTININGYEAVIFWYEDRHKGEITIDAGTFNIILSGKFQSREEMIKIAERIV